MSGVFDFLHIKGQTAGSSNELSFDVLEHKSAEANGKNGHSSAAPKAPKASRGNYRGVAGTSTLSGQAEVERRKKARRSYRIRLQVIGTVAIVALVVAGIWVATRYTNDQADLSYRISTLVDRLTQVDETLVQVDALMGDPLNAEWEAKRAEALKSMPKMTTELNRIAVDAQSMLELPLDEKTAIVVGQINKAAQSRNGMIMSATDVFRFAEEAAEQRERANRVWGDVLAADQLAREAISNSNKASTQDATNNALNKTREAREGFADALDELRAMATTYKIDFAGQEAYLAKKVEALDHAIATSEALLAGNREGAITENEAYNNADSEAAQLAADLPPSIGDIVDERFRALMDDRKKPYEDARSATVDTDSVIREYLG